MLNENNNNNNNNSQVQQNLAGPRSGDSEWACNTFVIKLKLARVRYLTRCSFWLLFFLFLLYNIYNVGINFICLEEFCVNKYVRH